MHHISKHIVNLNESIMLLFFNAAKQRILFSFILYLLCMYFFTELPFCPHFNLCVVYLWVLRSMLSSILRLIFMILVPDALCAPSLSCNILVGELNKIFFLITKNINILHGIYCIVFKNMCFWCDTKSKLAPGLPGGSTKISFLSDPLTG